MTKTCLDSQSAPTQSRGKVIRNVPIAQSIFQIRFAAPKIADSIQPGQFVMVRAAGRTDPLLARPYALYDVVEPGTVDVVYLVVGNGTRCLSRLGPGDEVDVWGPLGNAFPADPTPRGEGHLMLVAGGIGQTPFLSVIQEFLGKRRYGGDRSAVSPRRVTFAYGARSADYLTTADFEKTGVEMRLATDDGSRGRKGFVTDLVAEALAGEDPPTALFGCGPEPMLKRLAAIAAQHGVACWTSLETKMACGYGVCFSCVAPIKEADGWDYQRVCIEGSVFSADAIAWDQF